MNFELLITHKWIGILTVTLWFIRYFNLFDLNIYNIVIIYLLCNKIELTLIYTMAILFFIILGFIQIFIPEMLGDILNFMYPKLLNYAINIVTQLQQRQQNFPEVQIYNEINETNIRTEEQIDKTPNTPNIMQVTLLNHMGTDLTVVNAARCSFGKTKDIMDKSDEKLISYLAKHHHWSPFGHTSVQFHIKAPIFVVRQLGKHQVGLIWNEISRRYVDSDPEFYLPTEWRLRAENVKQGSSEETIEYSITDIVLNL